MILVGVLLLIAVSVAMSHGQSEPPCKPGDCDTCPFPPCSEEERRRHMGE
mgnify:CR=1 FL=1|jgi:hypothetical protein